MFAAAQFKCVSAQDIQAANTPTHRKIPTNDGILFKIAHTNDWSPAALFNGITAIPMVIIKNTKTILQKNVIP